MLTLVSTVPVAYSICEHADADRLGLADALDHALHGAVDAVEQRLGRVRDRGIFRCLADGDSVHRRDGDLRAAYVDAEDHDVDSYPRGAKRASAVTCDSPPCGGPVLAHWPRCGQEWGP